MKHAASVGLPIYVFVILICGSAVGILGQDRVSANKEVALPDFWERDSKPISIVAPDGRLKLWVVGRKTGKLYPDPPWEPEYYLEKDGLRLSPRIRPYSNPKALWSPSSQLLAITSTDGGLVGSWKVSVYSVTGGRAVKHSVMDRVQADLAKRFPGGMNPEGAKLFTNKERREFAHDVSWVNVVVVRWVTIPERLVVEASVPPSSRYGANLGRSRRYVINPRTGEILGSYPYEDSKE